MARPHIEPYVELNDAYQGFDLPAFPSGSLYKVLSMDADTGACSLKMRFDAGYRRKPGMSYSDSEMFILEGRVTIGATTYGRGQYFFIPAGVAIDEMYFDDLFNDLHWSKPYPVRYRPMGLPRLRQHRIRRATRRRWTSVTIRLPAAELT